MVSPLAVLLLLTAGATVFVLALALAARAHDRALAHRLELIKPAPGRDAQSPAPTSAPAWPGRALFTFRMRRSWGISAGPVYLLAVGVAAAVSVGLLGRIALDLPGYIVAIGAAGGFFLVPRFILVREQRRSDNQFAELLPDAIDMVVRVVRVGLPVSAAIRTVGQEAKPPVSTVFAQVADQAEIGVALNDALARTGAAVGNPDFRFFAVAVALQQATGGNLAATLETLSQIVRKRRVVRLKAMAASAEVRLSAVVLGAMPFLVTAALLTVAPTYLDPLFVEPRGHIILGLALFGLLLAGITMRTMIRNSLTV